MTDNQTMSKPREFEKPEHSSSSEYRELYSAYEALKIDNNSWQNCQRKLNEANERIVEFESIKAGHLEYIKQIEDAAKVIARQLENTQLELAAEKAKSAKLVEALKEYGKSYNWEYWNNGDVGAFKEWLNFKPDLLRKDRGGSIAREALAEYEASNESSKGDGNA